MDLLGGRIDIYSIIRKEVIGWKNASMIDSTKMVYADHAERIAVITAEAA